MQTMTALVRVAGDLNMTVRRHEVTPAEALLLMHIHDSQTKDVFEGAVQTEDVERSQLDERARLQMRYPEHKKLIDHLFPGRNAADVPDAFDELLDVPLEVAATAKKEAPKGKPKGKPKAAANDQPLTDADAERMLMHGKEAA